MTSCPLEMKNCWNFFLERNMQIASDYTTYTTYVYQFSLMSSFIILPDPTHSLVQAQETLKIMIQSKVLSPYLSPLQSVQELLLFLLSPIRLPRGIWSGTLPNIKEKPDRKISLEGLIVSNWQFIGLCSTQLMVSLNSRRRPVLQH